MDFKEWKSQIDELRKKNTLRRAKAIRLHCLDCMGYELLRPKKCTCYHCPLWEWRTGHYTPLNKTLNLENERTGK